MIENNDNRVLQRNEKRKKNKYRNDKKKIKQQSTEMRQSDRRERRKIICIYIQQKKISITDQNH